MAKNSIISRMSRVSFSNLSSCHRVRAIFKANVYCQSPSHFTADGHSAGLSWYRLPSGTQILSRRSSCYRMCLSRVFVKYIHIYILLSINIQIQYLKFTTYNVNKVSVSSGSVIPYLIFARAITAD